MPAPTALEEDVFTGKIDFALWRKLLFFMRPYRRLFLCLIALAITVAIWDAILPRCSCLIVDAVTTGNQGALPRHLAQYLTILAIFVACILSFILVAGKLN